MVLGKNLLIFLKIFETIFVIDKALGSKCALGILINIVDSTLVYCTNVLSTILINIVIYHIGTFDRCICRIYNDRIN